jgi:hypothetical protein
MGSHSTLTEESTPHDRTFFGFFEETGTFRFRQERGYS